MAINGGEIKYSVNFDVKTQQLTQAFDKIRNLSTSDLMTINPKMNLSQARTELNKIRTTTTQLESAFTKAFNPKLNTVNIKTFKKEISNTGTSLQEMYNTLKSAGEIGENAFRQLSTKMLDTNIKLKETSNLFKDIGTTLKNTIKWNISSSAINTVTGKIQEVYGYVKNLDSSLNDIRIVTGQSADQMEKFALKANKAAEALGKSTTDYTKASLIYYQQGLNDEETEARTDVTLKAANVTQQSTSEVSEQLTAVWNGYKVSASEAELYIDKLAAVAAGTASDLQELSAGMSKVASAANAMGVDIDQMNAMLSTTISVTREAPESVGTAYKTILSRMSTIQAGDTAEDGATLTSYTKKMNALGINVLDANNRLREMGDVVEEVGGKWSSFSKEQQLALAQVMAGTRQYNNLIALFDNWDKYQEALKMSAEAAGTLNKQQEIYMESTQAHLQTLSTALEGVFDSILSGEDINEVVDNIVPIVHGIEDVIDAIGGGTGALQLFAPMLLKSFSPEIAQQILTIHHNLQAVESNKQALDNLHDTIATFTHIEGLDGATEQLSEYMQQLDEYANFMTPEEFEEQKKRISDLGKAYEEYGQARINTDKALNKLQEALGDENISRDNYKDKIKQAEDAQKKIVALNKVIQDQGDVKTESGQKTIGALSYIEANSLSNTKEIIDKTDQAADTLKGSIKEMQSVIQNLANDPASTEIKNKFEDLNKQMVNAQTPQEVAKIYNEIIQTISDAADNGVEELEKIPTVLEDNIDDLIIAEERVKQSVDATQQATAEGFSDEQIRNFTEGTVELASSMWQVGAAAVSLGKNLSDIWNNDDLTNGEKFAQTLELIAINAGIAGNGLSSAKKAITQLASTYRASIAPKVADTTASTAQAEANKEVEKSAKGAADAVKEEAKADKEETKTSTENAIANKVQANANKDEDNKPALRQNIGDAAKGIGKTAKAGIEKIGTIGQAGASSGSLIGGMSSLAAGVTTLVAAAVAIAAITAAVKLSYDAFTETERAVEKANENYETAKNTLSEINSQVQTLDDAISSVDKEKATLSTLVTGTTEWNEQLKKVNESVASLLEQFPELKQYATFVNGNWQISEEGLKVYQQKMEEKQNFAQNNVYASEVALSSAERNKLEHEIQLSQESVFSIIGETLKGFINPSTQKNDWKTYIPLVGRAFAAADNINDYRDDQAASVANNLDRYTVDELQTILNDVETAVNSESVSNYNEVQMKVTKQFGGLKDYSLENVQEYLHQLISLQETQNELDKLQVENSKAMLDNNFGDQISTILTSKDYNERQAQIIKNAIERRAAQDSIIRGQTIRSTLLTSNGSVRADSQYAEEFKDYIKQQFALKNGLDLDKVELNGEGGNTFHLRSTDGEAVEKADYEDYIEQFIAYMTTSDETAQKRLDSWMDTFEASNNGAYFTSLADEIAEGNVDISTLTRSELDTLEKMAEEGIAGININSLKAVLARGEADRAAVRETITSESGQRAYDKALSLAGADTLTEEQLELLADKINKIYSEAGKEGVEEFERQIQGQHISVALNVDIGNVKDKITAEAQQILDDAKIDAETFKVFRENANVDGKEYSDEQLARTLAAQKDLNKIYKERKTIFKALQDAKIDQLTGEQQGYIVSLQKALSTFTGMDLQADDIVNNIDLISKYFNDGEEGLSAINNFITKMNEKYSDVTAVFEKFSDIRVGMTASETGLNEQIQAIANRLGYTEDEIKALYYDNGFLFNNNTGEYEKVENASYILELQNKIENTPSIQNADANHNVGDVVSAQNIGSLLKEYGVETVEELEELGWKRIDDGSAIPSWRKISNLSDLYNYSAQNFRTKNGATQVLEKYVGEVLEGQEEALKQQQYFYDENGLEGPGWYRWVNLYDVMKEKTIGDAVNPDEYLGGAGSSTKTTKEEKKITHKYDINYDTQDNLIKAKEKELKRLQEVEDDLIGEDLLQNLKDQKEYYEDILKLQREKLNLTKKDVETQKSNLNALTNGEIKFDEDTGYILNSAQLLQQAEANTNAAKQNYNVHKDEDAETLNPFSEALTKAENDEKELKELIDNYNKAIDTSNDVADELDEINAKLSEINVSSQIKVANQELEKTMSHMSSLNDIISTTVSEFQKLSGPEAMEAFNKFIEQSNKLEDAFNAQKEAFHNSANSVFDLAKDLSTSGLTSGDMGFIGEMQDFFNSDENIFDQSAYIKYTERAKEELSKAKAELSKATTEDDKKKAQEAVDTWAAITDWLKEAATNAKTLQQNIDDIYLTSGEIGPTFEDWQVSSIDVQIDRISKKINQIAREGKKLKGQDLINNILRQNDEIKKQIKLEKSKLEILKAQMMLKRTMLELQIQEFAKTLGITNLTIQYDKKTGQIAAESFKKMNDVVVASLAGAGELGAAAQQQWNLLQQSFESYQQSVSAVQSSLDAIDSFEDSIEDNFQSIKDAMKEMRDKALEIFNAKVDVEVDIEEAWRKLNKLEAKMDKIKDNDFLGQAQLNAYDAQSYLTANPNSYFGDAGGGSVQILTTHVNDIMGEINTMLGGGTSSLYGKNQTQAFSDLRNYADQLMSQVEAFYDALDAVRQQYSACVDAILNKNKELLDDISKINDLNNQGINITKLLHGDNSFDKLQSYYTNIADNTKRLLEESVKQKEYYSNFMKQFSPNSDEYAQAKSAYQESMTQVYEYGQQLLEQYAQELMNKVSMYEQKMKDSLANLSGFADTLLSDQDWEYQTKLINDYLDDTNTAYEMNKLQDKFQTAIDDTDVVSSKKELTKVMNEQLGILEKQLEDGQLLTKYDIDRANKVYELTLKQIALEEAQNNKSKMRLRRDSQGNYRYEFVADLDKVNQAKQELADAQNDLYNFDKDRTVEMINEIKSLQSEYYNYRKSIIEDDYLSEEEKKQALEELYNKYYGVPEGLLYMTNAEYQQARDNMESDTDANIEFYAKTTAEALSQNWNDVAAAEKKSNDQIIVDITEQQIKVNEALDLMKQGYSSLEESIQNDVSATENLVEADQELLNQYAQQLLAIKDLMDELEELEEHYKSVMEAAKQALEASLLLRQNNWEDDETDDVISNFNSSKDKNSNIKTDNISDDNAKVGDYIRYSKKGIIEVKQSWWDSFSPERQQDWLEAISDYQGKSYKNVIIPDDKFKKKWGNRKVTERISFDTGGYTGEWGKEGKMAILHEKELVLNKDDTKNILQTVDITRNLISSLAELKNSFASSLTALFQTTQINPIVPSNNLQQEVHIEAVFPNVSEKSEIEEAFNDLVNLASQRAMSTKK